MRFGARFRVIFNGELGKSGVLFRRFKTFYLKRFGIGDASSTFHFHLLDGEAILFTRLRSEARFFFEPMFVDVFCVVFDRFFLAFSRCFLRAWE